MTRTPRIPRVYRRDANRTCRGTHAEMAKKCGNEDAFCCRCAASAKKESASNFFETDSHDNVNYIPYQLRYSRIISDTSSLKCGLTYVGYQQWWRFFFAGTGWDGGKFVSPCSALQTGRRYHVVLDTLLLLLLLAYLCVCLCVVPASISLFYPTAPSVDIHVGDTLQLDCRATGRPPPNITWTHLVRWCRFAYSQCRVKSSEVCIFQIKIRNLISQFDLTLKTLGQSQATLVIICFPRIVVVNYVNVDVHSICLIMILRCLKVFYCLLFIQICHSQLTTNLFLFVFLCITCVLWCAFVPA